MVFRGGKCGWVWRLYSTSLRFSFSVAQPGASGLSRHRIAVHVPLSSQTSPMGSDCSVRFSFCAPHVGEELGSIKHSIVVHVPFAKQTLPMASDSPRFSFSQSRHTQPEPSNSQTVPMGVGRSARRGMAMEHCPLVTSSGVQTWPGWLLLGVLCHKWVSECLTAEKTVTETCTMPAYLATLSHLSTWTSTGIWEVET